MHPLLLSALIQIESGGNDQAKGRHGELGALQIKPILVRDVNRIMGTHYAHNQMTNRAVSTFIATAYLSHYGKNLSDESLARIWQGGPKGHRKTSTRAYGRRVMRELQSMDDANRTFTENHHFTVR
jgi:soluble lytic murein transglycosylase-like protein